MSALRISVVQMNSGADVDTNLEQARQQLRAAADTGAQLVVLPENFAAMGPDEAYRASLAEPPGSGALQAFLADMASQLGIWIVGGTLPIESGDPARPYSTCFVFDDGGTCRGRYDKLHLFDVRLPNSSERYRESANTRPGESTLRIDTPWGGLAVAVCYDLRFPEMFRSLVDAGFNLLTIPAAFTYATGQAHWQTLLQARAIENLCFVAAAAQAGTHPGNRRTYGHSAIIGPWGDMLARGDDAVGCVSADVDLASLPALRQRFPVLQHRRYTIARPD